ncbi:MAG: hypothetical protein Q9169_004531 [Polycauliona sp. 2 TL-2023]
MDAFKGNEILRMEKGGNSRWRAFWEKSTGKTWGRGIDGGEMKGFEERYGGDVGEEWKERLSCEVEGREYLGVPVRETRKKDAGSGMGGIGAKSQKEMNEDFFARKGNENETRRADLPPSQGGKYGGFGSGGSMGREGAAGGSGRGGGEGIPGVDEFQKDPMAALTKGFGWFTTTVGKSAKSVNDGWIQPNVQKLAESDLTSQARLTATQVAQNIQTGSKNAAEQFNRFVEDSGSSASHPRSKTAAEPEHKDFWDSFGSPAGGAEDEGTMGKEGMGMGGKAGGGRDSPMTRGTASPVPKSNSVGTAAMRKGAKEKADDKWEDF